MLSVGVHVGKLHRGRRRVQGASSRTGKCEAQGRRPSPSARHPPCLAESGAHRSRRRGRVTKVGDSLLGLRNLRSLRPTPEPPTTPSSLFASNPCSARLLTRR
jgi:hypothetical protein